MAESISEASTSSANANDFDPTEGFTDLNFRAANVEQKRRELLEQRRRVLEGSDPTLQVELGKIREKLGERRIILTNRLQAELKWVQERSTQELSQLEEDENEEMASFITKLTDELEEIKQGIHEQVQKMNIHDRKTLNVFSYVDQKLKLYSRGLDDHESSYHQGMLEKRAVLPGRLISDAAIREDLAALSQCITTTETDVTEVAKPVRPRHRVILDKTRLIYDGKTFYRGQKLFVQSMSYTRFPAIVYALADEYVHIRSRTPGDTREVFATIDDLRTGRVRIGRKIVNSP